ncbi:MAG: SHOCT domain-containing protein [Phycisphaerae bacterium]
MPSFSALGPVVIWSVVLLLIGAGGIVAAALFRRWSQREQPVQNFTLQDLRELLASGQISAEEYDSMRAVILGTAGSRRAPESSREPSPPPAKP